MNPLRRVLSSVKTPTSKPWHLVITPDPHYFIGIRPNSPEGEREYYLRLDSNFNLDRYCTRNPTFAFATNNQTPTKPLSRKAISTEWIRIIDTDRKTSRGVSVQQVLIGLLRQFPSFNLQSTQAAEEAINTIESHLAEVASFEEARVIDPDDDK